MVEEPAVEDAPSNLAATGRYLLGRVFLTRCAASILVSPGSFSLLT